MHREERDIQSLWAAIADREAHLLALVKASAQIVWITDKDGNVLEDVAPPREIADLTWSAFTGLPQASLIGGGWLAALHPDDLKIVGDVIRRAQATGAPIESEFRVRHRSGEWRWIICRGSAVRRDDGAIVGWIGAGTDISAARRAEEVHQRTQQQLEAAQESLRHAQKMQALGTLAGGIAHDFNNLLLAISGNLQLALGDLHDQHPSHSALREISRVTARASELVRRILTFSAQQPSTPAITPLQSAMEEIATRLRSNLPPNIRLTTTLDAANAICTLAQSELEQALTHLVDNSVHAIDGSSGSIELDVRVERNASALPAELSASTGFARIAIRDSGSGMSAETRARVFEPFFTTKLRGKGTGLSLAVVHGIVRSNGGAIAVESEPGRGTTFILWLPLKEDHDVAHPVKPPERNVDGRGEHILYVDDDEAINFLIQRLLTKAGYRVTGCDDPVQAHALFTANPNDFDVVVTDLSMPAMSGFDLIQKLRAIRPDVPVIMTSGYVGDDDQARASSLGIGRIILKPNTVDELGRELDARCGQLRAPGTSVG